MPAANDRDEQGCCFDAILREMDGAGISARTPHSRAEIYEAVKWSLVWRRRWDNAAMKLGQVFLTALAVGLLAIAALGGFILWGARIHSD